MQTTQAKGAKVRPAMHSCPRPVLSICAERVWLACNTRRGLRNGEQAKSLRQLAAAGCQVTVSTLDIEVPEQARQLVALTAKAAPLGGIFHLAMYLDDNLLVNQVSAAPMPAWVFRYSIGVEGDG